MLEQLISSIKCHLSHMSATQVLRLLHYAKVHINPTLLIELRSNPNLCFHAQEVENIKLLTQPMTTVQVTLNISGLFGACGILPNHYTYDLLSHIKEKNKPMIAFINLLQHTLLEQLMQTKLNSILPKASDYPSLATLLGTLLGSTTQSYQALLPYIPSIQQPHLTAFVLKSILSRLFKRDISINENSRHYIQLPETAAFLLGSSRQLGINTIAGHYLRADHQHLTIVIPVKNAAECHRLYHDKQFQQHLKTLLHALLGIAQPYRVDFHLENTEDPQWCMGFSVL